MITAMFDAETIDGAIDSFHKTKPSPALAVAIVREGEFLHSRFVGCADLNDPASRPDRSTLFRIASISKSFTAAAILALRDQHKLKLNAAVGEVLPSLTIHERWHAVTIHQLLSMTAGIITDNDWADRQLESNDCEYASFFMRAPLFASPETKPIMSYSNLSYMLLARIIAIVAETTAREFISERFLKPLALKSTVWNPTDLPAARWSRGYRRQADAWVVEPLLMVKGDGALFGGLWSSVSDLAEWVDFLSSDKSNNKFDRVLSCESRVALQQNYAPVSSKIIHLEHSNSDEMTYSGYGYGLRTSLMCGRRFVGHSGGLPGYGSHIWWDAQSRVGVVAFANSTYCPVWDLSSEILSLCRSEAKSDEPSSEIRRAATELTQIIRNWHNDSRPSLFASNLYQDLPSDFLDSQMREFARFCEQDGIQSDVTSQGLGHGELILRRGEEQRLIQFLIAPLEPLSLQKLTFFHADKELRPEQN